MRRDVVLFGEDKAHRQVINALIRKIAREHSEQYGLDVHLAWYNAAGGYPKVVEELKKFLHNLQRGAEVFPDLIVVAIDANRKGLNERAKDLRKELRGLDKPAPMVLAIPDPHIERWLLLDGAAFKAVFGRGCVAPDLKYGRDRYKQLLLEEIRCADPDIKISGLEFVDDVVENLDVARAAKKDPSFARFVADLRSELNRWVSERR